MVDIDPKAEEYSVRFKPKEKRQNKLDDKMEILRQVLGLRDTNNILDLVKEAQRTRLLENKDNPNIAKDNQTIVDINLYEMPSIHIKLTSEQVAKLSKHPDIRWVEKAVIRRAQAEVTPWGVTRVKANTVDPATKHRGYGVKVAVIDTGINYNHVDLKPNYKGGTSFVSGITDPMDDNTLVETSGGQTGPLFHGTHCSGTIAAAINNSDVVGVAPEAFLYAVKILDKNSQGTSTAITQGIVWADQNDMDVLSMSFAGAGAAQDELDALQTSFNNGRFNVAAAGNNGQRQVSFPAAAGGVFCVGAVDQTDTKSTFSQWSDKGFVDFVAPGNAIQSDTGGKGTTTGTRLLDGTSQATPHIAGIYALGISNYRLNPCDTSVYAPGQSKLINIVGAMISSCDTLNQTSPGVQAEMYGFGMPQVTTLLTLLLGE